MPAKDIAKKMPRGIIDVPMGLTLFCPSTASLPSPPDGTSTVWILAAIGALMLGILLPRLRRRRKDPEESLGSFGSATGGAREELERLLTEIQDLSREHIARLDSKIRMLNQLLLECDQKKRELEALLGQTAAPPPKAAGARAGNPLHDQVYQLKDSGKDLLDICQATGLEKGEVELILGLRGMPPGPA